MIDGNNDLTQLTARHQGRNSMREALLAYKGSSKPKKAKVVPTPSSYASVDNASFATDFGKGQSGLVTDPNDASKKVYQTTANLSPELKTAADTATTGLTSNLAYLQTDPQQRVSSLLAGEVPMYNALKEQSDRATAEAVGRQRVNAQLGGLSNSTTLGAALGRIANDDILRQNTMLTQGLDWGNTQARTDAALGLNTLTGLNNLVTPLGAAAASQLQTAKSSQDAAAAATAAAQNTANLEYTKALNAYNQANQTNWGSLGGAIGGSLALAAAPFTGGASLALMPALAGIGSGIGSGIGGGSGSSASGGGSYGDLSALSSLFKGSGGSSGSSAGYTPSSLNGLFTSSFANPYVTVY